MNLSDSEKLMLFPLNMKLRMSEYTVNVKWKIFSGNILRTVLPLKSAWFSY